MQNYKFILLIALSAFFASCAPTNLGYFSSDDLSSYRNNYQRISSYQFNAPYGAFHIGRGRVEMTGMYSLQNSRTAGLTELGQIDLVIDFSDRDASGDTVEIPIVDGQITGVTHLGYGEPEFGVGWDGTLAITDGFVTLTDPGLGGGSRPPQLITFKARGTLTQITPDGEGGSVRRVDVDPRGDPDKDSTLSFEGQFMQQEEFGSPPFSADGNVTPTTGQSDFYLEQVR
jgi:hypothetical protein